MKPITRRHFLKGLGISPLVVAFGCNNEIFPSYPEPPIEEPVEEPVLVPRDYLHVVIEYDDSVDLSEAGQSMSSAQKAVSIFAPGENRFNLGYSLQTSEIWLVPDTNKVKVFYRDIENIPNIVYAGDTNLFADILFKNNQNTSLEWKITPENRLMVYLETGVNAESLESHFNIVNGEVNSLGDLISRAEPNELIHKRPGEDHLIGLMDTDFEMDSGIVVMSPARNGASDQVVLKIPALEQLCHLFVVDDTAPARDVLISTDLADYLVQKNRLTKDNYRQVPNRKVGRTDLANRFTSVVYNGQARLIVGDTSPASHTLIAVDSAVFLRDKYGIDIGNVLLDSEVGYDDLTKLF